MKSTLAFIAGFVAVFGAIYGFASFVCWDFNPGHWDADSRFLTVFIGTVLGAGVGVLFANILYPQD